MSLGSATIRIRFVFAVDSATENVGIVNKLENKLLLFTVLFIPPSLLKKSYGTVSVDLYRYLQIYYFLEMLLLENRHSVERKS
jgi:hypothetical protein